MLVWGLAVSVSLSRHESDIKNQGLEVATEAARNLFRMVVLTRAWNAGHGGVYVPVSEQVQPNPYLKHPRRDLTTDDGRRLTMINPAFMTRQISELAQKKGGTVFHITSLKPIRPANAPDGWERAALTAFEAGGKEVTEVVQAAGAPALLRYMAPLKVDPPCMACHAVQGYRVGDIRGGISVSQPFEPVLQASRHALKQTRLNHVGVFLLVALLGWFLLEMLRRRWHDLAENLDALEQARDAMASTNAELARARDAAEGASRAKSAFLGAMSHELRTPLNGILGFAHLLQHADLPSKARDHARHIAEQGGQLLGLIDEVMEFTRLETLERPRHRGRLDPGLVLSELAQVLRRAAADMGLAVRIDLPADLPPRLAGEADWLAGCLRPLIHNAVKFTETGEVGLSVRGERSETGDGELYRLRVTVHDSGVGIAEQDHGKLFQPFRQTDDSTARRFHGLGLGLAVSARYAALLGGRLDFDSAPGRGSRFCLDWTTRCLPPAGSETGKVVTGDAGEALAQLRRLLSQDDLEAHRALREALPLLAPLFDAEDLARLGAQVEKFDYGAALETLAEMRELSPGRP
jgi:signal transduction histidine kinase